MAKRTSTKPVNSGARLKQWKSLLETDQDSDYRFLLDIMSFKLGLMKTYFETSSIAKRNKTRAAEIRKVQELIDRAKSQIHPVSKKAFASLEKKYGRRNLRVDTKRKNPGGDFKDLVLSDWDLLPIKTKNAAESAWLKAFQRGEYQKRKDLQQAFKTMSENIWDWWD